jgi:hypothetical protein
MAIPLSPQNVEQLADVALNGSPALVSAAGRLIGLGQAERSALAQGKIPAWFWMSLCIVGGVAIGVRVQKAWPRTLPEWITGGKRS